MIWLLRICFSVFAVASVSGATVKGKISLEASKEKRVKHKRDFSSVVVWLEPRGDLKLPVSHRRVVMEQKEKTFSPHVVAIPVGSSVDFPNFDPIFHNAFSNYNGQNFDVGLYPPKTSRTVKFNREGVVRVFCNIHPAMSAVIVVLRSPLFAVTGEDGLFEIRDVPPGDYTLGVFHERATESTLSSVRRAVTVSSNLAIPPIAVSEAGYIALPHKNKYGKEYPAVIKDTSPYPGGSR
jgi:plastocyanin